MKRTKRWTGVVDELEGRALLSGTQGSGSIWSNPAVQADLAKIKTDQQTLIADTKTLAPTIQTNQKAIQAAITSAIANDANVQSAEATLKTDQSTAQATLKKDWAAIWTAPNFSAAFAAVKVYLADAASAAKTIGADQTAVQTAIDADSGVAAAKAKLKTDVTTLTQDQTTLQADYTQLEKDIQSAIAGPSTTPARVSHG